MKHTKINWIWRVVIYVAGLMIMSIGITLSAKTGLGVSTSSSLPYAISKAFDFNFSVTVCVDYLVLIFLQFVVKGKNRQWRDLLQLPVNIVFSSFLGWFGDLIPLHFDHLWQNVLMMAVAVVLTGSGLAMMVNMEIVPNPPDGLTYAVSEVLKKDMGFVKNVQDFICVAMALAVDLLFSKKLASVGIGTVMAMLFIGRTVSVFNRFFKKGIQRLAGLA